MSSIGSPSPFFLAGKKAYQVERSLRFNDDDSAYLNRTPSSTSNRKTFTISWWFKLANLGTTRAFFGAYDNSTSGNDGYYFSCALGSDDKLYFGAWTQNWRATNRLFRDPSAWYHCVLAVDTTESTANNRVKIYINGIQETSFSTTNNPSEDFDLGWNFNSQVHTIGRVNYTSGSGPYHFDGYIAEFNSIDGLQLTPSSFGETNATTGQWIPKKYVGSYGTNGFYLNFSDNSGTTATTLGKDSSGNGNNFTPNNFSVSAGAGNDSLEDTPTNNFPTFNPLVQNVNTFSEGNLQVTMTSNAPPSFYSTMGVSSGKYYMEFLIKSVNNYPLGISGSTQASNFFSLGDQIGFWIDDLYTRVFRNGSNITSNSVVVGNFETGVEGSSTGWAVDDIAGLALDMDNKIIYLYKGSTQVGYVNFSTFNYDTVFFGGGNYINGNVYIGNFGQRPFAHTPPTGYKALCSANLPDPTILLPNKHFDTLLYTGNDGTNPISGLSFEPDWVWIKNRSAISDHILCDQVRGLFNLRSNQTTQEQSNGSIHLQSFNSDGITVAGTGSNSNSNGDNFVAWNWNGGGTDAKTYKVKVVADSTDYGHGTGANKYQFFKSDGSTGFGTNAVDLNLEEGGTYIFDWSDSSAQTHPIRFSLTNDGTHSSGTSAGTEYTTGVVKDDSAYKTTITIASGVANLYYYCQNHSGMGAEINTNTTKGSTNFDGSILSVAKANTTAGFSIVTYTGNGSDGATIGHGLGVKPDFIVIKKRANNSSGNTGNWIAQHKFLSSGVNANSTLFTLTSYSNTMIYLNLQNGQSSYGFDNQVNGNTDTFVAYCWHEVPGYSKFGSYLGDGTSDGQYVHLGFRPAWVMIKQTNGTAGWMIYDSKRSPLNQINKYLQSNSSGAEVDSTTDNPIDFLSDGMKMRYSNSATNSSSGSYIYMAFAEQPGTTSFDTFPNAR